MDDSCRCEKDIPLVINVRAGTSPIRQSLSPFGGSLLLFSRMCRYTCRENMPFKALKFLFCVNFIYKLLASSARVTIS